jgi:epoxyqueuosine reductase
MTHAPPSTPAPLSPLEALRERIRARALESGFARAGFTTADPLGVAAARRWARWLALGRAGTMTYLERAAPRRTHPRDLLPAARTALAVAAGYYGGDHGDPPPCAEGASDAPGARGKIARYAWGRDYHLVLRERLEALGGWIAGAAAEAGLAEKIEWRACVDSAPLDERALAARAGLGFIGKNTLLIAPKGGSWSVLGVLLLSLELPPDAPLRSAAASCGPCRRCLEACPPQAFTGPWQLDPRRCISYRTIELRPPREPAVEDEADPAQPRAGWAFGCDVCQEVCPFNAAPLGRMLPELAAAQGAGAWLTRAMLDAIPSGKAFQRRFGHTPLARPGLRALRRNLDALKDESSGPVGE